MNNFVVCHLRRIHTQQGGIEITKHNFRKKENLETFIDITKSHLNFYNGATNENYLIKYNQLCYNLPRKIQKNASRLIEVAVSFSPEYGEGWETDPEKQRRIRLYFDAAEKFFVEWFGIDFFSRTDHWDEKTPHTHITFVPLCRNKDGILRFSSSEFLGGRKKFFELHDNFYLKVGKPFGLERGIRNSRTPHYSLKQYEEWEKSQRLNIEKEKKELEQKRIELEEKKNKIDRENEFLEKQKRNIFERMGEFFKKFDKVSLKEKEFEQFEKDLSDQTPQIETPPILVTENQRTAWRVKIQSIVNDAFEKVAKGFQSIKMKHNDLVKKYNDLLKVSKTYYVRAINAENDLDNKPLKEIEAERKARLKEKQKRAQQDGHKDNPTPKIGL